MRGCHQTSYHTGTFKALSSSFCHIQVHAALPLSLSEGSLKMEGKGPE